MGCVRHIFGRKSNTCLVIFFFLFTPFLSSCGGGAGGGDATGGTGGDPPADTPALTQAAADQNRAAQTAVDEVTAMASALDAGQRLIDDYFGSLAPTEAEIEAFVLSDPEEAALLIADLKGLASEAQTAADAFSAAVADLQTQEALLADRLGDSEGRHAWPADPPTAPRAIGLAGGLAILTLVGALAAAGKGASDAMHRCDHLPLCDPMPPAADPRMAECMQQQIAFLECTFRQWPSAAGEAVKGTITSVVTTVGSWATDIAGYKRVKIAVDAYGAYDSVDGIRKGMGIRRCDRRDPNLLPGDLAVPRQLESVTYEELRAEDIYIGTSQDGTFHNVPPGEWTFLFFEEGHIRQTSACIDCTGDSPVEASVTLIPIAALEDDDGDGYSEYAGDCNDLSPQVHPGAAEGCADGVDNDCNGQVDCADAACDTDPACDSVPSGTRLSLSIDIPGHGSFSPNLQIITLASCSETGATVPSILASDGGLNPNPFTSDVLTVNFNNDMGTGTWPQGFGPCETPHLWFTTQEILNEDDGSPVTFFSTAGSVTLDAYGTSYGDPLQGSFSFQVAGDQTLCPTAECEGERTIGGTISGQFEGVISDRIQ